MSNDEILTVKETAALLKTTRQQVRKMIANEELPAFWSVGCLTRKSELFRLRFVLFTTVHSADFPLFPSSPARSNSILGQNWVRVCERSEAFSQDSLCGVEVIKAASQTPL